MDWSLNCHKRSIVVFSLDRCPKCSITFSKEDIMFRRRRSIRTILLPPPTPPASLQHPSTRRLPYLSWSTLLRATSNKPTLVQTFVSHLNILTIIIMGFFAVDLDGAAVGSHSQLHYQLGYSYFCFQPDCYSSSHSRYKISNQIAVVWCDSDSWKGLSFLLAGGNQLQVSINSQQLQTQSAGSESD